MLGGKDDSTEISIRVSSSTGSDLHIRFFLYSFLLNLGYENCIVEFADR